MRMINLGCGNSYHKDWVNIDFVSHKKEVLSYNLLKGIPYPDNYFDVVYHSHLLEHFTKTDAIFFIKECYRVLKPQGIIRTVVPNLEKIVDNYKKYLDLTLTGDKSAEKIYDWIMLTLYDQCVRNQSGGEMLKIIKDKKIYNKILYKDTGYFYNTTKKNKFDNNSNQSFLPKIKPIIKKFIPVRKIRIFLKKLKNNIPKGKYRQLGKFRLSGEIHQWMYDRFSLTRLLQQCNFKKPKVYKANESEIKNWDKFFLDTKTNGSIRKPDSLFIEAIK